MADITANKPKLSTFRGRPGTVYQEQVFNDQSVFNFPATLQSTGQSLGYTSVQGYFTVPKPESVAAPLTTTSTTTTTTTTAAATTTTTTSTTTTTTTV